MRRGLICAVAGAGFGLCMSVDLPSLIGLCSLATGFSAMPDRRTFVAVARGATFGASAYSVSTFWMPEVLASLGAPGGIPWLLWGLAILVSAAVPYAVLAVCISLLQRSAILLSLALIEVETLLVEATITHPAFGLPALMSAYPISSDGGLIQLAAIAGTLGLSCFTVGCAYLLSRCGSNPAPLRLAGAVLCSWIVVSGAGTYVADWLRADVARSEGLPRNLLLIQPSIPHSERWVAGMQAVNLGELITFSKSELAKQGVLPSALVWPENIVTTPLADDPEVSDLLLDFVESTKIPLLTGLVTEGLGGLKNSYQSSGTWFLPGGGESTSIKKAIAIPLIEAYPQSPTARWLDARVEFLTATPRVVEGDSIRPLPGPIDVVPLLCYEAFFGSVARLRRTPESIAVLNLSDDGWSTSDSPPRILLRLARLRGIEQRLPVVRLSQGGQSVAFDALGRSMNAPSHRGMAAISLRLEREPPVGNCERIGLLLLAVGPGLLFWSVFPIGHRILSRGLQLIRS